MLNWIAVWVGAFLFGLGGPLQNDTQPFVPVSNDVVEGAKLPVFWGDPVLQGLHVGFFVALGALVVYWIILNRTTLGYEVRAVGFNPEAARYGGISVRAQLLPRDGDLGRVRRASRARSTSLGWQYRHQRRTTCRSRRRSASSASRSRCSAATPRSASASRRCSSRALINGTSTRNLDPEIFRPELAVEPDADDPGPRRPLRRRGRPRPLPAARARSAPAARRDGRRGMTALTARLPRGRTAPIAHRSGSCSASLAFWVALPPLSCASRSCRSCSASLAIAARDLGRSSRRRARLGWGAVAAGVLGIVARLPRDPLERRAPRPGRRLVGAARPRCSATRRRSRSPRSAASSRERSGVVNIGLEGMMLIGRLLRHPGRRQARLVGARPRWCAALAGGLFALVHAVLRDPPARRPDRLRDRDQLPRARDHRLPVHRHLRRRGHAAEHPEIPDVHLALPRGLVLHRARRSASST